MTAFSDSTFTYTSYAFDPASGRIELRYNLDGTDLLEVITIPMDGVDPSTLPSEDLDRALFALHLMVGIGYWKTTCPKNLVIESGTLTRTQAHFWNMIYTKGLGEFYYKNDIDFRDQVHFPYSKELEEFEVSGPSTQSERVLIPFGGGKDSVVTAELVRKAGIPVTLFSIQAASPIRDTVAVFDAPHVVVERALDPALLDPVSELRRNSFNGHVPISAIWSLMTVVTALIHGASDITFSWERSASEGNLEYLGMEVNHQWSKSIEFERSLQAYLETFVTKRTRVFSLVRPLSEFHLVKLFTGYPQYFSAFSSCNRNFTQAAIKDQTPTFWCQQCPKCAYLFNQLDAFLPHDEVVKMIGADMYENEALLELYRELLGIAGNKPFECVGEAKEVAAGFELTYRRGDANHTAALQLYVNEARASITDHDAVIEELLTPAADHAIPQAILDRIDYDAL